MKRRVFWCWPIAYKHTTHHIISCSFVYLAITGISSSVETPLCGTAYNNNFRESKRTSWAVIDVVSSFFFFRYFFLRAECPCLFYITAATQVFCFKFYYRMCVYGHNWYLDHGVPFTGPFVCPGRFPCPVYFFFTNSYNIRQHWDLLIVSILF